MKIENFHDVIGGLERIFVAERDKRTMLGTVNETNFRFENYGASAFGANQRARNVKIALGNILQYFGFQPPYK